MGRFDTACAGRFSPVKYTLDRVGTANRASGSLAPPIRTRGMHWVERGSQLACAALIASHAPICALAHEPRESPAIIFHGNGSVGATGRRCRYKLAASGGSAGCVRQLEAPIWLTPIAGGYETARKRRFFAQRSLWRCVSGGFDSSAAGAPARPQCNVLGKALAPQAKLFAGCAQGLGTTGAPAPTHPTLYKPTRQPTHAPRTFQRGWCALTLSQDWCSFR